MQEAVEAEVERVAVPIQFLADGAQTPQYAHATDAGADLVAAATVRIEAGARELVPTGIAVAIPPGFVALVHPRSGLALRTGLTVLNAPGTIDADYRGEIQVILHNTDRTEAVTVERGDRIAQLVLQRVAAAQWTPVAALPETGRGEGGFGSTGGHAAVTRDLTAKEA